MSVSLDVAQPKRSEERRIYNPVQKDSVTFLKTSAETDGAYTRAEVVVAPGGGTSPHYHLTYAEHFEVVKGDLEVMVDGETRTLRPGEKAVVPPNTLHCFRNRTNDPTTFVGEARPGSPGFEKALRVLYGLAEDGRVRAIGVPKNVYDAVVIGDWSDMRLPGVYALLNPVFRLLLRRARHLGVDHDLEARYCA
jgi:mannose-6-phosphate isomerase-like protein (cupin superfamily)